MTETNATAFKARRIELGLTQQDLADRCLDLGVPVSDSQISKIERNQSTPLPGLRRALKVILGDDPVVLQRRAAKVVL
ncbi:helix-turn-helix domain-containing protein [Spirillospora sp. NBC_00431]